MLGFSIFLGVGHNGQCYLELLISFSNVHPVMVAEWAKALPQIQVEAHWSQVEILFGDVCNQFLNISYLSDSEH